MSTTNAIEVIGINDDDCVCVIDHGDRFAVELYRDGVHVSDNGVFNYGGSIIPTRGSMLVAAHQQAARWAKGLIFDAASEKREAAQQREWADQSEIDAVAALYEAAEPTLRPRMLELLSDYAKSDGVARWARQMRADTDPEYRLRRSLRSLLVDTLPMDAS